MVLKTLRGQRFLVGVFDTELFGFDEWQGKATVSERSENL
jgi:hypothetical protein